MNYIIILLALFIIAFLWKNYSRKQKLKQLKIYLVENWGKPKNKDYFNFFNIKEYFENNSHKEKAFHLISDRTASDLDIDDLFKFIDRTSSKIGQQFLYYKLRTIHSIEKLQKFELLTNLFIDDDNLRLKTQVLLSKLNSHNAYDFETIVNSEPINKPHYLKYIYILSFIALISLITTIFYPIAFLILLPIFFINIVFHYKNKQNVNYYLSAINQLSKSLKVGEKLANNKNIKNHFIDTSFISKIKKIKSQSEFISFDRHIDDPFLTLIWLVIELIKIQFNIGTIMFYSFINSITNEKENLDKLFQFIGEIDSAIAIASVKSGNKTICKPQFVTNKEIKLKEIHHPLIENCIVNDLELNNKSLLLTGSNMSGKTTFIRTLAINNILAQTLNFTFAKEFSMPFLKVYSSIRISDDLLDKTSYYLKEVLTIKEFIEVSNSSTPCLFVLDEIFKGTNTIERISGGKAILSYLNKKQHFVAVSTHDIELTDLLKEEFDLYHFTENISDNELNFDHKLKKGKLTTRNAIKILDLYNYPKEIIIDAKKVEKEHF
jgi:DNA mismatch repair ATPase MutS